jgi:hypothetical protein
LDLNTQLAAVDAVIRGKVMAIANNYGISNENFTVSGQVASGFSLKVANHALERSGHPIFPLCADVESELYRVIARINNTELTGKSLPEDGEFTFNPGEVEFPATWDETERQWRFEIELGAANAIDYLVWKDPQITREAAEKKLSQINDENSRVGKKKSLLEELITKKE